MQISLQQAYTAKLCVAEILFMGMYIRPNKFVSILMRRRLHMLAHACTAKCAHTCEQRTACLSGNKKSQVETQPYRNSYIKDVNHGVGIGVKHVDDLLFPGEANAGKL
jgi:hypothetical protein